MNKTEMVDAVASKSGLSRNDAQAAIDAVFSTDDGVIASALRKGEKVVLTGFGNFEVRSRNARTGRNPQTGAELHIPASKAPAFKPGKSLKDAVS